MKKTLTVILLGLSLLVGGCGGGISNDTPMNAAKMFMQACIDGDQDVMKNINHSNPLMYPSDHVLQMASDYKLYNSKLSDYDFTEIDEQTIEVKSEKTNLNWKLHFTKEKEGWFFNEIRR